MKISNWILVPLLLSGCSAQTAAPLTPSSAAPPAAPVSASNAAPSHPAHSLLESLVRQAHDKRDLKMMRSLVYQLGVDAKTFATFDSSVRTDFDFPIRKISFEKLDPAQKLEYTMRGVTYRPNLPPTARMKVEYAKPATAQPGQMHITSTSYLIGAKDEIYYLVLAAPVAKK